MTTIGGKQFINRGTSENPIYQRVGSSTSIVSGGTAIDGANVSTGTDAPESPADGDLWFNETVGSLFVYIDGTGWVESNPGGNGGSSGPRAYLTVNGFSGYAGGGYGGNTIITSHNISSITYGTPNTYYINFENPVTDPVVQVSHGSIQVDSSYEVADGESFCRIQLFTDASKTWWTGQVASNSEDFLSRYIVGGDVVRIGVRITQDGGLYKRVSPLFVTVH